MTLDSLKTLLLLELRDLYDAERRLVKALPKMANAASSEDLRLAFVNQLNQTQDHLRRVEGALALLQQHPGRMKCKAMEGILEEAEDMIQADGDPAIKDAGLISAAQRVGHYEMARYGCARTYAEMLDETDSAELLQQALNDVRATDESLTELAVRLIRPLPVDGEHAVGALRRGPWGTSGRKAVRVWGQRPADSVVARSVRVEGVISCSKR